MILYKGIYTHGLNTRYHNKINKSSCLVIYKIKVCSISIIQPPFIPLPDNMEDPFYRMGCTETVRSYILLYSYLHLRSGLFLLSI